MALPSGVALVTNIKGNKGDPGTFAGATAESVPATQNATVTMSGPETARMIHLEVPRGLPGTNGVPSAEAVGGYLAVTDSPSRPGFDTGTASLMSDPGSAARVALAPRLELVDVNVKDYGAVGDGVADDTAAIQAAVDSGNGRKVVFPPGTYKVRGTVKLKSDTHIYGPGAKLTKKGFAGTDPTVVFAAPMSPTGEIVKNIEISHIAFEGSFPARGVGVFWGHKTANLWVHDVDIFEAVTYGHVFDLGGCTNVTIERTDFYGAVPVSGREWTEAIQLDNSGRVGMGSDLWPQTFDGTACSHVKVTNCRFLPYLSYKAPRAMGSHAQYAGKVQRHIEFTHNYLAEPNGSTSFRGALNFTGVDNLTVKYNNFDFQGAPGGFSVTVAVYRDALAIPLSEVNNPSPDATVPGHIPEMLDISDNIYVGGVARANGTMRLVYINGFTDYSNINTIEVRGGMATLTGNGIIPPNSAAVQGTGSVFGVLPERLRPSFVHNFLVPASGGSVRLLVYPNGELRYMEATGSSVSFTSCTVAWAIK